jgi:hypothetical protein
MKEKKEKAKGPQKRTPPWDSFLQQGVVQMESAIGGEDLSVRVKRKVLPLQHCDEASLYKTAPHAVVHRGRSLQTEHRLPVCALQLQRQHRQWVPPQPTA